MFRGAFAVPECVDGLDLFIAALVGRSPAECEPNIKVQPSFGPNLRERWGSRVCVIGRLVLGKFGFLISKLKFQH